MIMGISSVRKFRNARTPFSRKLTIRLRKEIVNYLPMATRSFWVSIWSPFCVPI